MVRVCRGQGKICVPPNLHDKFAEMFALSNNREVDKADVPQEMLAYIQHFGRTRGNTNKLLGTLSANKILLHAPLLKRYIEHGLEVTALYRTIDQKPKKIFEWLVEQVTAARRVGDDDKAQDLLADVFKLLGNHAYKKIIETLERQTNATYTKLEKFVDHALQRAWFDGNGYDEIGDA